MRILLFVGNLCNRLVEAAGCKSTYPCPCCAPVKNVRTYLPQFTTWNHYLHHFKTPFRRLKSAPGAVSNLPPLQSLQEMQNFQISGANCVSLRHRKSCLLYTCARLMSVIIGFELELWSLFICLFVFDGDGIKEVQYRFLALVLNFEHGNRFSESDCTVLATFLDVGFRVRNVIIVLVGG